MFADSLFRMTRSIPLLLVGAVFGVALMAGCDSVDPTDVENPRTTDDDLAQADDPTASLLPGVRAQFSRAIGAVVITTELTSDNYSINGTGLGGNDLDFPANITPNVAVLDATGQDGAYWNLQELRALAEFILSDIIPSDENATDAQEAEVRYYRGMAFLMLGENFAGAVIEEGASATAPADLLSTAVAELTTAQSLATEGELDLRATAALARAYRALGQSGAAQAAAQEALALGGADFLFAQPFDANNLDNGPHDYLVQRSLQEMQPLPRLDFLDPKYTLENSPIPVAKAEEMYLILAEVALANGNEPAAQAHLLDALATTNDRPTASLDDTDERLNNDLDPRPRSAEIEIAPEPGADFVEGLVLERPGPVETPTVSGTHVTAAQINAATGPDLTRLLYLLRQEILFLEGRRLHDLGIRLPVMLREIDTNPAVSNGDPGTTVEVPAYIPPSNEIDLYEPIADLYDNGELTTTEVTIMHDMNRVLAEQRGLVIESP